MAEQDCVRRVIGAACQGPVGAAAAAFLSAAAGPIVSKMRVKQTPLMEAVKAFDFEMIKKFFQTTFSKYFVFEGADIITQGVVLAPAARGAALGLVFRTIALPITKCCFRKSMNLPVTLGNLCQALGPTVLRDVIYSKIIKVFAFLIRLSPIFARTVFAADVAKHVLSAHGTYFHPKQHSSAANQIAMTLDRRLASSMMATPPQDCFVGLG